MPSYAVEVLIVLLLILLNGAFAMAEMAIVLAHKVRLEQWASGGDPRVGALMTPHRQQDDSPHGAEVRHG